MKKVSHFTLSGTLMAISWIILLGFVVQWLVAQYKAEKEILVEELNREFLDARLRVMDSTLLIHIIDPMIRQQKTTGIRINGKDSLMVFSRGSKIPDTLVCKRSGKPKQEMVYSISISDSGAIRKHGTQAAGKVIADVGNMVMQSIRLIVDKAMDTVSQGTFSNMIPDTVDTILFRKLFTENMEQRGFPFSFCWNEIADSNSTSGKNSAILLSTRVFDGRLDARINHYSWYLLKKIVPNILFASILLFLTAGAFLFTFRSLKKQVQLNEVRNNFISNITHELKTPVATVKVALESLRNFQLQNDPVVANDYLHMASMEMDRLDKLIGKVLNVSVLSDSSQVLSLQPADLKSLTSKVVTAMMPRIATEQAGITLEMPDEPCICLIDNLFMEGVIVNLIDNSLKYHTEPAVIRITIRQDERTLEFKIRDNGPGIPEQYLERVFDKFFRVPQGDRHNVKGHGLGLSYAALVMKQHGGTISAANLPDGGCEFTLIIPKG